MTGDPLPFLPRFTGDSLDVTRYRSAEERETHLLETFGSQDQLWDLPDVLRFDASDRMLVGAEFRLPYVSVHAETSRRVLSLPAVTPGGLRADADHDFRHEMCTVLCRVPGDAELVCVRDVDVLEKPLDTRIGIAPDVALLVQDGSIVGWNLADPVRYLATGFADADPTPPAAATRRLFSECLDLVTPPLIDDLVDGEPAALARLLATDAALRAQREDRLRADALRDLIATYVTDYASG